MFLAAVGFQINLWDTEKQLGVEGGPNSQQLFRAVPQNEESRTFWPCGHNAEQLSSSRSQTNSREAHSAGLCIHASWEEGAS